MNQIVMFSIMRLADSVCLIVLFSALSIGMACAQSGRPDSCPADMDKWYKTDCGSAPKYCRDPCYGPTDEYKKYAACLDKNIQVYNHNLQVEACPRRAQQSKQDALAPKVNAPPSATAKTSPAAPQQPSAPAQPTTNADWNDGGRGVRTRSEPDFNTLKAQGDANTAKVKAQNDAEKAKSGNDGSVFPTVSPETGKRISDWQQRQSEYEKNYNAWRANQLQQGNPKVPKISPANPPKR
jgi:hypothetical protein